MQLVKMVRWQVWFTLDIDRGGSQRMAGTDEIVMDMQLWLAWDWSVVSVNAYPVHRFGKMVPVPAEWEIRPYILRTSWTGGKTITGPSFGVKWRATNFLQLTEKAKSKPWNPCNHAENLHLCMKRLNTKMWQHIWISNRDANAGRTSSWFPAKGLQGIRSAVKLLGEILMALAVPAVVWTKYRCGLTIIYINNVTFHSTTLNSHQGLRVFLADSLIQLLRGLRFQCRTGDLTAVRTVIKNKPFNPGE